MILNDNQKNEIIPRGPLGCTGQCVKCKKVCILYLMEITIYGKTDELLLCIDCYEELMDIVLQD